MCCFSGPVAAVSGTRIFARALGDRQLLVYAMRVAAAADVAMVLPLPVPPGSPDDAVRFVDFSAHAHFFDDLESLFPRAYSGGIPAPASRAFAPQSSTLVVHSVGAFEASFVPRPADFERLDPRFRLPAATWDAIPAYRDWGFAVFKLRREAGGGVLDAVRRVFSTPAATPTDYHPMALELPRRDPSRVFFPTVHVHDGAVHPTARFDHTLYVQAGRAALGWSTSQRVGDVPARPSFVHLDASAPVQKRAYLGENANEDVWV